MSVVDVETARWRDAVAARLGDGARFAGAWAAGHEGAARWSAAFVGPDHETLVLGCAAVDGRVPTIVDLVPACTGWASKATSRCARWSPIRRTRARG